MQPPGRRLTTRALLVIIALFALDLGGIAATARIDRAEGELLGIDGVGPPSPNPLIEPARTFFVHAPFVLICVLLYLYVPPRVDAALTTAQYLAVGGGLLLAPLKHALGR